MTNVWQHRFAILVACCVLFLIMSGANLTSQSASNALSATAHRHAGENIGLLAVILGIWLIVGKPARWLGVVLVLVVLVEILLGRLLTGNFLGIAFFHALLAQLLLAASAGAAIVTSPSWQRDRTAISDRGWPSLRGFAVLTCMLVLIQVAMGAAYRHELMGVMWHLIGALLLALFILGVAMLAMGLPPESCPQGNPLRIPSIILIVTTSLQLVLGLTIVSLSGKTLHSPAGTYMTIAHTANGALTMGSMVVLTLLARRCMRREA